MKLNIFLSVLGIFALAGINFVGVSSTVTAEAQLVDGVFNVVESDGVTILNESSLLSLSDTFDISLALQPDGEVTYVWDSEVNGLDIDVSPNTLTFDTTNWDQPQTITVVAIDDDIVEGPETTPIIFILDRVPIEENDISIADTSLDTLSASTALNVEIIDDEGLMISGVPQSIAEGESATLDVIFSPLPTYTGSVPNDVVVTFTPTAGLDVNPSSITVTPEIPSSVIAPTSFSDSQTVTITAVDDGVANSADLPASIVVSTSADENVSYANINDYVFQTVVTDVSNRATDHNSSRSNKTSSCTPEVVTDGVDDDCDGVECDLTITDDIGCIDYPNNGDANNDGTEDFFQDNVTVTRNEKLTVAITTDSTMSNVSQRTFTKELDKSTPLLARSGLAIEDIISFEVLGSESSVDLLFYTDTITNSEGVEVSLNDLDTDSLRAAKIDPETGEVVIIEDAVITIQTIDGQQVINVEYDITDGGELDEDGVVNGTIIDPVGLISLGEDDSDTSGLIRTGGDRSKISPVLLSFAALVAIAVMIKTYIRAR